MYELNKGLLVIIILILLYSWSCQCEGMCACAYPVPRQYEQCCGRKDGFACLPTDSSNCIPGNSLLLNNRTYWIKYSRDINGKKVWALSDRRGWALTLPQALIEIPIGSTVCWNGQKMGNVIAVLGHENMPYSSFIQLDRSFDIDLSGQNVNIAIPPGMTAQSSGVVM